MSALAKHLPGFASASTASSWFHLNYTLESLLPHFYEQEISASVHDDHSISTSSTSSWFNLSPHPRSSFRTPVPAISIAAPYDPELDENDTVYAQALLDSEFARWLEEDEEGESNAKEEERRSGTLQIDGKNIL
ncbi:hypothetical protein BC937DRAFT_89957 [Endogone sp. FLAS-F59071]|nr:hypothetical protein BC937DRAFT_89957 [Endogone sp. FLAS-F59071]|eukprot:RUS22230.1 hypothetical protein BC937DRAFT_89957 [Endogone sp. FLAS-F59071]